MKIITLIVLLAGITLVVLGLTDNQHLGIPGLFALMKNVSAIYPAPP